MIEYPSISPSSKAPRANCIAFNKLDGSNIRVKYTHKKGFSLFGSRTQLFDNTHPFLADSIDLFKNHYEEKLIQYIEKVHTNEREVIAFFEFFGEKSFAGFHHNDDPKKIVLLDILIGNKNRKFLLPQELIKVSNKFEIEIPKIIYQGNLTDDFIKRIREGAYEADGVFEGVVCKGTERSGAYRGNVWMTKIKTSKYFDLLKNKFGEEEAKKYGE